MSQVKMTDKEKLKAVGFLIEFELERSKSAYETAEREKAEAEATSYSLLSLMLEEILSEILPFL